jgi:hypothetical protein
MPRILTIIQMKPVANIINFFGIIYAPSGVFPNYFDRSYADSNVIMSKKSFITCATAVSIFCKWARLNFI